MAITQKTYPSRKIVLADMPEVANFGGIFRYNFFTKDELISENTLVIPNGFYVDKTKLANVSPTDTSKYDRFVARYVLLQWDTIALPSNSPNDAFEEANKNIILENLDSIYSETNLTLDEYNVFSFRDENIDGKTKLYADIIAYNAAFGLGLSESLDQKSLQEVSKILSDATPEFITTNFISELINQPQEHGIKFFTNEGLESVATSLVEEIKTAEVRSTVSNRFIYDIVKSSVYNPNSLLGDELVPLLDSLKSTQEKFRTAINPSIISGKDYDFELEKIVDFKVVENNISLSQEWKPSVFCTGYLIEKYKQDLAGNLILQSTDSVEDPSQGYYFDDSVKYGDFLTYAIYAIFVAQTFSTHPTTGEKVIVRFLVKSKPRFINLECKEEINPSTPADFSINWDYDKEHPILTWAFPLNPQRDIKFFKIYKRNSINEPFKLMSIYDFNDLIDAPDYVMPGHLIKKLSSPETFWIDYTFTKSSKEAIYAIVCVDARGLCSSYTQQLQIKFDEQKNILKIKQIAAIGSPIAYPNMTLNENMFSDVIKTSNASKFKLYFDPEYYNVFARLKDGNKKDLGLLSTSDNLVNGYMLQMINVDLQEQAVVKIELQDNRIKPNITPNIQDVPSTTQII